ncbi:glycosyltransferase [Bacillus sp. JJ664]
MPKVSVLMSVYNGEKFLAEAVKSILNQTFKDFEFVIIDDGSTDRSLQILQQFSDKRIRLLQNEQNKGLVYSLNRGLEECYGEYIVRMDADDIANQHRLDLQVSKMDESPDVVLLGSSFHMFYYKSFISKRISPLNDTERVKTRLLFQNAIAHPTTIIRAKTMKENELFYDEEHKYAEDYGLWNKLASYGEITNLQEPLLQYRLVSNSQTARGKRDEKERLAIYNKIVSIPLSRLNIDVENNGIHFELAEAHNLKQLQYKLEDYKEYLSKLMKANELTKVYHHDRFKEECASQFYRCCLVFGDYEAYNQHFYQITPISSFQFKMDQLQFKAKKRVKKLVR